VRLSADAADLQAAPLTLVAVPPPIDEAKRPDLQPLLAACETVGAALRRGDVVVFESTVYPGCTEEDCVPVLERVAGLRAGQDFAYGYSPERINPGDREHTVERLLKVVSGSDPVSADVVEGVYADAIPAGIHRAPSVATAEAAKVIENTQRDLNIALVNELALIFHRLGIDTQEVLAAAGTKWNFLPFRPGLVGGHCIGVDPYYLTHRAEATGYHPQVILAGRRINDGMGAFVAQECVRLLIAAERPVRGARVAILGLTFKENCPDVRNSRVVDIVRELERFEVAVAIRDPHADPDDARAEHGIDVDASLEPPACDALILAVAHDAFRALTPSAIAAATGPGAPLLDVKGFFAAAAAEAAGLTYWRL